MMNPNPAPLTLEQIVRELTAPFPYTQIELKPGALTQNKERCLVMPYLDLRAYEYRLDEAAGIENWSTSYQITARGVVCALTICGVTKSGIGDYPLNTEDENPATSAQAQAFKRACSAFGIGRYLYDLPKVWCDYDATKKQIIGADRAAWDIYYQAGLLTVEEKKTAPPKPARAASTAPKAPATSGGGR